VKQETLALEIIALNGGQQVAVALKEEDINGEPTAIGVIRAA
jgi:hypothetical protein